MGLLHYCVKEMYIDTLIFITKLTKLCTLTQELKSVLQTEIILVGNKKYLHFFQILKYL